MSAEMLDIQSPGAIIFNGLIWVPTRPEYTFDMLGFIPGFFDIDNPLLAAQQIDRAYGHGGGWRPFMGFALMKNGDLKYPEDPPTKLLYRSFLRDEALFFYQHSWFRIEQPDGGWQVARLD